MSLKHHYFKGKFQNFQNTYFPYLTFMTFGSAKIGGNREQIMVLYF